MSEESTTAAPSALQDLTAEESLSLADSLAIDEQHEDAVDAYTAAILLLADSSKGSRQELHIRALSHRSAAFYQLGRHQEALEDAQSALSLLSSSVRPRGLRPGEGELCHKRAGLAALELGDHEGAKHALEQAAQLASLNKRPSEVYSPWIQQCNDKLTPASNEESETPIVEEIPTKHKPSAPAPAAAKSTSRPQMPKYQYYQSNTVMTIAILEPNVTPEDLTVTFGPQKLTVQLRKGGVDFTVIAGTLYSELVVDKCKVVYKDEKVLIKLRKKDSFEWHELFGKKGLDEDKPAAHKPTATTSTDNDDNAAAPPSIPTIQETTKPRPYSSHRDWDAIERNVLEEEKKEKPQGDEAMNKLFQQIYANADEDTRRAMIKSYQTSGGTVLSTNWDEVRKKDYENERTARDGVEWKNWEGERLPAKKDD